MSDESDKLFDQARTAVGKQKADDYILAATAHADSLNQTAPALAQLLRRGPIQVLAQDYERLDKDAVAAQTRFIKAMTLANRLIFAAAICTAAVMALAAYRPVQPPAAGPVPPWIGTAILVASWAAALSGGLAAATQWKAVQGKYLDNWMRRRAGAETTRLSYFKEVTAASISGDPVMGQLLKLAYFCRYQLDVQRIFYMVRGGELNKDADKNLTLAAASVLIGTIVTAVSASASLASANLLPLAALGAVGVALSSYASAKEALRNNRRTAERYERTYDVLNQLTGRVPDVAEAIFNGQADTFPTFVAAVHEQLSLEHRQFLEAGDSQLAAMAKLKEQLEAAAATKPKAPQAAE